MTLKVSLLKNEEVKKNGKRILTTHVLSNRDAS
jgi:hypothetical protein